MQPLEFVCNAAHIVVNRCMLMVGNQLMLAAVQIIVRNIMRPLKTKATS